MSAYPITWITSNLAIGFAPMSYAELESIKNQGIDGIVNLCAEFSDLHELEESSGFEVYYLPCWDESVPDMDAMEKSLSWLDEALYLGKKILVHCRYGIGRTGTFVISYMIRKGMGLKDAAAKLKTTSANPSSYRQWRMLKKYGKKSGGLKIREPSLENGNSVNLSPWFADYEALIFTVDAVETSMGGGEPETIRCGLGPDACCHGYFTLQLIEVVYLTGKMNRHLKAGARYAAIERAVSVSKRWLQIQKGLEGQGNDSTRNKNRLVEAFSREAILCPLNDGTGCILYDWRPMRCRCYGIPEHSINHGDINTMLFELSRSVFFAFSGMFLEHNDFTFSMADTVSGKFVQKYFNALIGATID